MTNKILLTQLRIIGIIFFLGLLWAFFSNQLHGLVSSTQYPNYFNEFDLLILGSLCFVIGAVSFNAKKPKDISQKRFRS